MATAADGPAVLEGGRLEPSLSVNDLVVEFGAANGAHRVVDHVSFQVQRGETLGLVGQSGSGKSMTALAIMGLLRRVRSARVTGSVRVLGKELVGMSQRHLAQIRAAEIALVMQDPMSSLNPAFTIGEQIAEVVRVHEGLSRTAARRKAVEMLEMVEIPAARRRVDAYPFEFSGGMRQRALIAIALACTPKVLIADEPTTALDVTVQAQILELLRRLQRHHDLSILFITHDLGVVAELCDRIAVMYEGQIVEIAESVELFEDLLHPYTEELLRSTPEYLGFPRRVLPEGRPSISDGCRFAPRCAFVTTPDCGAAVPLRTDVRPGHAVRCVRAPGLPLDRSGIDVPEGVA